MSTGLIAGGEKTLCRRVGNEWVISGDAYVITRLMMVFPLATRSRTDDSVTIPSGPEQCRDLLWFIQRYPMKIEGMFYMRQQAAKYMMMQSRASKILSKDYEPRDVNFARGLKPREYQSVAADLWRSVGGMLLGDDLGLGKTVSAITALTDPGLRPAVVVCPPHLIFQWKKSIERFTPEMTTHIIQSGTPYDPYVIIDCHNCGNKIDRVYELYGRRNSCPVCRHQVPAARAGNAADVYLLSYGKLMQWPDTIGKVCKSVVYDEVHALRGGSDTNRWKAAHRLSKKMSYRLGMSATPFANLGGEAFNILECLIPGNLGTEEQFQENWCAGMSRTKAPALMNPSAFSEYLRSQSFLLKRNAVDLGLPVHDCEIIYQPIEADTAAFDKATSKADEMAKVLLDQHSQANRGAATMEFDSILRQATGIAKVPNVVSIVEDFVEQGEKVVVFAWHKRVHELLSEKLEKYRPVLYTGGESRIQKEASVTKFVNGDSKVFIMSLRSGEGLDGLQFASCTAVVAELDWTWAVVKQNVGRIARSGQTRPCKAYFPVTDFGSDPIVSQVLGIKKDQLNGFLGEKTSAGPKRVNNAEAIKLMAKKFLASRS